MPSYLGEYGGSATDRINKFNRAVKSFLDNIYPNKELIIISDGCKLTNKIFFENYSQEKEINLITVPKQPLFSGYLRDLGLKYSTGNIICYLDTDDMIDKFHLLNLSLNFNPDNTDWCYFNDSIRYFNLDHIKPAERVVRLEKGLIGTSSIAHKRSDSISWNGLNGYGHDWEFVNNLMRTMNNFNKINNCGYIVCHIPNSIDN